MKLLTKYFVSLQTLWINSWNYISSGKVLNPPTFSNFLVEAATAPISV